MWGSGNSVFVLDQSRGQLRHAAAPVTLGTAVISRGLEDHASFATQATRSTACVIVARGALPSAPSDTSAAASRSAEP